MEDVGVSRVDKEVSRADPSIVAEDSIPRGSAVGSFIHPAITAFAPERTLRSDPYRVGIVGVDDYFGDVFGVLESEVGP